MICLTPLEAVTKGEERGCRGWVTFIHFTFLQITPNMEFRFECKVLSICCSMRVYHYIRIRSICGDVWVWQHVIHFIGLHITSQFYRKLYLLDSKSRYQFFSFRMHFNSFSHSHCPSVNVLAPLLLLCVFSLRRWVAGNCNFPKAKMSVWMTILAQMDDILCADHLTILFEECFGARKYVSRICERPSGRVWDGDGEKGWDRATGKIRIGHAIVKSMRCLSIAQQLNGKYFYYCLAEHPFFFATEWHSCPWQKKRRKTPSSHSANWQFCISCAKVKRKIDFLFVIISYWLMNEMDKRCDSAIRRNFNFQLVDSTSIPNAEHRSCCSAFEIDFKMFRLSVPFKNENKKLFLSVDATVCLHMNADWMTCRRWVRHSIHVVSRQHRIHHSFVIRILIAKFRKGNG